MSKVHASVSSCRHCRFYQLQGRRGGHCHQLGAPVQAGWNACPLAIPLFLADWELEQPILLPEENIAFEPALEPVPVVYSSLR